MQLSTSNSPAEPSLILGSIAVANPVEGPAGTGGLGNPDAADFERLCPPEARVVRATESGWVDAAANSGLLSALLPSWLAMSGRAPSAALEPQADADAVSEHDGGQQSQGEAEIPSPLPRESARAIVRMPARCMQKLNTCQPAGGEGPASRPAILPPAAVVESRGDGAGQREPNGKIEAAATASALVVAPPMPTAPAENPASDRLAALAPRSEGAAALGGSLTGEVLAKPGATGGISASSPAPRAEGQPGAMQRGELSPGVAPAAKFTGLPGKEPPPATVPPGAPETMPQSALQPGEPLPQKLASAHSAATAGRGVTSSMPVTASVRASVLGAITGEPVLFESAGLGGKLNTAAAALVSEVSMHRHASNSNESHGAVAVTKQAAGPSWQVPAIFAAATHAAAAPGARVGATPAKSFLTPEPQPVIRDNPHLGTGIARELPVMHPRSFLAEPLDPSVSGVIAAGEPPAGVPAAPTGETHLVTTANRAVAAVMETIQAFTGREHGGIRFEFSVGGENLVVRVAWHSDEIRTRFHTDSPELRTALVQEWQTVSPPGHERPARLANPEFFGFRESVAGGPSEGGGGQGGSFAERQNENARPEGGFTRSARAPDHTAVAPTVGAVAAVPRGTSQHLHTIA